MIRTGLEELSSDPSGRSFGAAGSLTTAPHPARERRFDPEQGGEREAAIQRVKDAYQVQQEDQPDQMALVARRDLMELFRQLWWVQGLAMHYHDAGLPSPIPKGEQP